MLTLLTGCQGLFSGRKSELNEEHLKMEKSYQARTHGPEDSDCPESVIRYFLLYTEGADFNGVYSLLSSTLRTRYTPETLERDYSFTDDKNLSEHLQHIENALQEGGLHVYSPDEAVLPLGGGKKMHLVRESSGWRIMRIH